MFLWKFWIVFFLDRSQNVTFIHHGTFALRRELELEALFKKYEQESYERLVATIEGQDLVPKEVFMSLLRKIYRRQK